MRKHVSRFLPFLLALALLTAPAALAVGQAGHFVARVQGALSCRPYEFPRGDARGEGEDPAENNGLPRVKNRPSGRLCG